jgi:hypothetical protein
MASYPRAIGDQIGLWAKAVPFRAAAAISRFEATLFFVRIKTIRTKNRVFG